MDHGMAIWANGAEVFYRINGVRLSNFGKRHQMMYMDVVFSDFPVTPLETKPTNYTSKAIMIKAGLPGSPVPLVYIHPHLADGTLSIFIG